MSIYAESISMNLHEECLLKYLVNPLELFYTTELLKNSNRLIEENFKSEEYINAVESGKLLKMYSTFLFQFTIL